MLESPWPRPIHEKWVAHRFDRPREWHLTDLPTGVESPRGGPVHEVPEWAKQDARGRIYTLCGVGIHRFVAQRSKTPPENERCGVCVGIATGRT